MKGIRALPAAKINVSRKVGKIWGLLGPFSYLPHSIFDSVAAARLLYIQIYSNPQLQHIHIRSAEAGCAHPAHTKI